MSDLFCMLFLWWETIFSFFLSRKILQRALFFLMRCHLMISGRSCKGLIRKNWLHDKDKLATMLAQTSAAQFHPTLKKIIPQWHWAVLVLCFQHMQMLSELYCIQKSFFHDSFPPNFGVLQFKFYWKFHWKHALLFHLFLFQKPEAFFHANRCHEPSYLLIHFDALLIIWNSAVACSFTLLTCTSQSDKKSFMKRHDHQPPFFRRKILLFIETSLTWM